LDVQEALLTAQRCLFALSSILNLTSVICLYAETPPNQARIRNHIVFLQVIIILGGFHLDVLFEPIPLCPSTAMYCVGILCTIGVPMNVTMTKTSASTKLKIRRSLKVLFVQIVVPLSLIEVPGFIIFISTACQCIPFEINLSAYFVLPFHPIAHNLLLLLTTPAYRTRITSFVR
ncbi:hypothetical protein PFISCL1PPCAC_11726, partial [Pristionchus fissidentatus]